MNPSTITIVGHGPSLKGAGLGALIDSTPVLRLKVFGRFHNAEDYGKRTDYLCATDSVINGAIKGAPNAEYWVYCKLGNTKVTIKAKAWVPLEFTNSWNAWLQKRVGYIGSGEKGRNYSIGAAACLMAMEKGFKTLILAGFDTLLNPELEYASVYNPGTKASGAHIWPVENELIHLCAEQKGVELCELSPHGPKKVSRYTGEAFLRHGVSSPTSP